jgi:tRNA A37 threonylcarbamoyladenosine modification protein TsaB
MSPAEIRAIEEFSPRRYCVDGDGKRVLIGLSVQETFEFETLDALPPLDESGSHVAWNATGQPSTKREKRWLELYLKHDEAWKDWVAARTLTSSAAIGI